MAEFYASLPEVVSLCLCPSGPRAVWSSKGKTYVLWSQNSWFFTSYSCSIMKRNEKRGLKKQDFAIPMSTNDCVWNYSPLELLNRRARLHGSFVFLSKPAVEGAQGPLQPRLAGGDTGSPHCAGETAQLTQFEHSTAWHSTAVHKFNNSVTHKAVLMQSVADRAAEGGSAPHRAAWGIHSRWLRPSQPGWQAYLAPANKGGWFVFRRADVGVAVSEWNQLKTGWYRLFLLLWCMSLIYPSDSCSSSSLLPCFITWAIVLLHNIIRAFTAK